ncbi:polysaccharide biosynthesis/export family protein [Erythrobacter sp. THAF29]|uniref:polysaccharide biosynthesis/export family protein n=1 Tax=Erythrobacter sp. THAF29 TaxID=2587851 RepID=UPI001F243EE5|nr:polysaccharide biosynthesis/export family protein [Erythrobacter sp. THAF29]
MNSREMPIHFRLFGAVAIMSLGACAGTPDPVIGATQTDPRNDYGQAGYQFAAPTTYALRPSDVISVTVFREPDFSLEEVRVGVDGVVSIPMIGAVPVGGMTTTSVEQMLTQRLAAAGLKSPQVSVNINEYASHLVTVEGAVKEPGVYQFQPGARLSSAIALARGTDRVADQSQVAIFRTRSDGIYAAKFDYKAVSQGTMLDPVIEPGDRVVVGTSGLSQAWQDALRAIPVLGIFASINY